MVYTIEELRGSWKVAHRDVPAQTELEAIRRSCRRPGMYRIAARVEPERHYFWLSPRGTVEDMDGPTP